MKYNDARYMSALQKKLIIKQWEKFVAGRFEFEDFTKPLYDHLHLHCSFIAHYDRLGFYHTYFDDPEAAIGFIRQFDTEFGLKSIEYGSTFWVNGSSDYSDVNKSMCEIVDKYKQTLYRELSLMSKQRDLAKAKTLLEKHGLTSIFPESNKRS